MKRVALIAALAASALTVAMLDASGSAQAPGERTLTIIQRGSEIRMNSVDNSPNPRRSTAGDSAGDQFVFFRVARNRAGARIGSVGNTCTVIKGTGSGPGTREMYLCHTVYLLRDGVITTEEAILGRRLEAAVTGGTGAYEGAEGSVSSRETPGRLIDTVRLLAD